VYLAVLIAPIREELFFRGWLASRLGILVVMPVGLCAVCAVMILWRGQGGPGAVAAVAIMVGALALYLSRWWSLRDRPEVLDAMTHQIFGWVFWGVVIVFGLVHVGNLEAGSPVWLWPVLVSPQLMVGAVLGYLRMRFGLFIAIAFHSAYNFALVTLATLVMVGSGQSAGMVAF